MWLHSAISYSRTDKNFYIPGTFELKCTLNFNIITSYIKMKKTLIYLNKFKKNYYCISIKNLSIQKMKYKKIKKKHIISIKNGRDDETANTY